MTWPLRKKWFWKLFFILLLVVLVPFLLIQVLLSVSPTFLFLALIVTIVVWMAFRSYRDWGKKDRSSSEGGAASDTAERSDCSGLDGSFMSSSFIWHATVTMFHKD